MFARFTIALGLLVAAVSAQQITGTGTISVVINGTWATANPDNSTIGCINSLGKLVLDDCATFTVTDYYIATEDGTCSFYNTSQPANTADAYGANVHSLYCWDHTTTSTDVEFYTINGFDYDWMCTGDTDCYYDIPAIPTTTDDEIDVWYFVWGSEEFDVPTGHYQALFLWEPIS